MVMAFIVNLTLMISEFLPASKAEKLWQNSDGCIWQVSRRREKKYGDQHRKNKQKTLNQKNTEILV